MGVAVTGWGGTDWSRARVRDAMRSAADRCAYLAVVFELMRVEPDVAEAQRRSAAALRWAEEVFRAWQEGNQTALAQLDANDLEYAIAILRTAERAVR